MVLARVIGTVVSTAKAPQLEGMKLSLVEKVTIPALQGTGEHVVSFDAVGANIGEVVFCVSGSSARMTEVTKGKPADLTIIAIVDSIDAHGAPVYRKSEESS
ncbi:MAG: EutN/CcmL family microcompartment protein [Sphaerochaeta sp.]|jgi:microcompartment protein CcmK/EutM|nr:EutN/CcmL family microcompartment protein [Sphaerochaeta sp.]MDX9914519.1 EutN/CcmL family microcompartment protein [Sphaerochaeta sp.]